MKVKIVILTGQGDTDFKILDDEIFEWIVSDFPSEQLPTGVGIDPNIPERVLEGLRQQAINDQQRFNQARLDDYTQISIGQNSYCNDRALCVPDSACIGRFNSMVSAINYCVENKLEVTDSMEGYIY